MCVRCIISRIGKTEADYHQMIHGNDIQGPSYS